MSVSAPRSLALSRPSLIKSEDRLFLSSHRTYEKRPWQRGKHCHVNWDPLVEQGLHTPGILIRECSVYPGPRQTVAGVLIEKKIDVRQDGGSESSRGRVAVVGLTNNVPVAVECWSGCARECLGSHVLGAMLTYILMLGARGNS